VTATSVSAAASAGSAAVATPAGSRVPFVTELRSRPGIVRLGSEGGSRITIRVELPEQWDTVAFDVRVDTRVSELMQVALSQFGLGKEMPEEFVLKLRGFDVRGENATVADSGARDGSTFLLTWRRRRPVR
jgi:hypothetical protein